MLTDFQNYFTTEKGIKFPTNPAIFHHILNMFPHYTLGKVKSSNLLRSVTDKLKNRITFDKNETLKLPCNWEDTVRLAHYNICSKCPPFAATQERRRRRRCLTASVRCRSRAGPGVPIPQQCAVATRPHFGFSGCTPAAEEGPISCNRPGWGLDYLKAKVTAGWSLVSRAWADRPSPLLGKQ